MKFFSMVFREFVYGSHLLSLGASGIVLSIVWIFGLPVDLLLQFIAYLVFQVIYTYNHYRELQYDLESNPERAQHISAAAQWTKIAPFVYMALLGVSLFFSNISVALLSLGIILGGILYTEYFKTVPVVGFKSYYVATWWALLPLFVPFFYQLQGVGPFFYFVAFVYIRLFLNVIFCDIKDIESDAERDIKTIPVLWGATKTLRILHIINVLSFVPFILGVYYGHIPALSFFLCLGVPYSFFYLMRAALLDKGSIRSVTYVMVDGEYFLWPLFILAGGFII